MLLHEVTKLEKLILVLAGINATSERSLSAMKRIKTYLKSFTSRNRLNHCLLLHVHCKKTNQLKMIKIPKEFVGDNQARLENCKAAILQSSKIFGRF